MQLAAGCKTCSCYKVKRRQGNTFPRFRFTLVGGRGGAGASIRRLINFVLSATSAHQEFPFKLFITTVKQTKRVNSA